MDADDDLMLMARDGNRGAFDQIVRRHQHSALSVAYRLCGTLACAEDVVQDSFVDLYRQLPRYRPEGKLRAFLFRIVLNRSRMARRSAARTRGSMPSAPFLVSESQAEAHVLAAERQLILTRAVNSLPARYRDVIVLRFAAGLRQDEIAGALNIPVGTVKSRTSKALELLRRKLSGVQL